MMECRGCKQQIVYRRSEEGNEWVHRDAVWDLWCEASPEKRLDPSWIRNVNWSRRRKRSKKLWKTTRGRGTVVGGMTVEETMKLIGEEH